MRKKPPIRYPEVEIEKGWGIADGEKIKITGVRILSNGRIIRNCKPGLETIFVARVR